jgi:hypothetical protein
MYLYLTCEYKSSSYTIELMVVLSLISQRQNRTTIYIYTCSIDLVLVQERTETGRPAGEMHLATWLVEAMSL